MAGIKFMEALNLLIEEKGIEKDVFLEMLKESIAKAYKKNYLNSDANVRVEINEKTGKFRLFELRTVVDDLEDEDLELSLEEAQAINPFYKIGDVVETEADVEHIGRLAAIQTKQLFRQKIRETEKETLYNEFADKKDDIITGIVDRVEDKFAIVNIGKTGAFLALNQQIPGEKLKEGQHLKVYVCDVDRGTKGTHIVVSRTEPNFVKRLFELEVPEVFDGTVEIKAVSREPGERSKIAVYASNENIDPIGSCVGPKGSRVKNVVDELNGEMIDIIIWSNDPVEFISNALSPSEVKYVSINEKDHSALVIVPDDQLSLAIGKRGQNARLAVRLTGWKIDIKSVSEALENGLITLEELESKSVPVDASFEEQFAQEMLENNDEANDEEVIVKNDDEIIDAEEDYDDDFSEVAALSPGVMGITGIETVEIVKSIVDKIKPDRVVAIDALASRKMDRVNSTIQISTGGIAPGGGVGNKRKALDKSYLGVDVIAIGVPTVVDAATLTIDVLDLAIDNLIEVSQENSEFYKMLTKLKEEEKYQLIKDSLDPYDKNLIVTPKDIDETIENLAIIISEGLNRSLHPGRV